MTALESVTRVAPFGVRFYDPATASPVAADLVVTYSSPDGKRVIAVRTPSGVYALRGLPGLAAAERGTGDEAFWLAPPATGTYRIQAADPGGAFLPVSFDAALPARGLFTAACGFTGTPPWQPVPGQAAPVIPLFSAPTRPLPPGAAVARAQLALPDGSPASWALLELSLPDGSTALGAADGAGWATVIFSYPEPPGLDVLPPSPGLPRLSDQTWQLGIAGYFGAASGNPVSGSGGPPDLCDLLGQQPVRLVADGSGNPLTTVRLRYGRELVAATAGRSTLLVSP